MNAQTEIDQSTVRECAFASSFFNQLSKKWTMPVIHAIGLRPSARFNELKRMIEGISAACLSDRLAELEKAGVIVRRVYPETPPRVEYSLTDKGLELRALLSGLVDWVRKNSSTNGDGMKKRENPLFHPQGPR